MNTFCHWLDEVRFGISHFKDYYEKFTVLQIYDYFDSGNFSDPGCSTAVEFTSRDREIVGSNHVMCWVSFYLFPLTFDIGVSILRYLKWTHHLYLFAAKAVKMVS